jgi:hypothetical protein
MHFQQSPKWRDAEGPKPPATGGGRGQGTLPSSNTRLEASLAWFVHDLMISSERYPRCRDLAVTSRGPSEHVNQRVPHLSYLFSPCPLIILPFERIKEKASSGGIVSSILPFKCTPPFWVPQQHGAPASRLLASHPPDPSVFITLSSVTSPSLPS